MTLYRTQGLRTDLRDPPSPDMLAIVAAADALAEIVGESLKDESIDVTIGDRMLEALANYSEARLAVKP